MITRLAPSPTGALHLGNARSFLLNWLIARQSGWKIILRIEDIDGPRIRAGSAQQVIDDLTWLGIDWDEGPIYQSTRLDIYQRAVQTLLSTQHAYSCICSRKEVELSASTPHAEDGAAVYPGTCRGRFANVAEAFASSGRQPAIRFAAPDVHVDWVDQFAGAQSSNVAKELGDFVIAKADGTPAYQLAVVADDAAAGITHVVRGDDLLDSTPRQMLIYKALDLGPPPRYFHFPLVIGEDGRRLAKRHGDTRMDFYRKAGVSRQRILAFLARWCGMDLGPTVAHAKSLVGRFDIDLVPRAPIVFSPNDDTWLRSHA